MHELKYQTLCDNVYKLCTKDTGQEVRGTERRLWKVV